MCQFNFLITKEKTKSHEIEKIAKKHNLNFESQYLNITTKAKLYPFLTTKWNNRCDNNCDCNSIIGKNKKQNSSQPYWDKERKKLENKNYSKNRIELLLKQKQKKYQNSILEDKQIELAESKNWIGFLNDKHLKNYLSEIGIFHHEFIGGLHNEKIKIEKEDSHSIKIVDMDFLKSIEENQLTWIKL